MMVDAAAEKKTPIAGPSVLRRQARHALLHRQLGQTGRQMDLGAIAKALGNMSNKLVDGTEADGLQHALAIGFSVRSITHGWVEATLSPPLLPRLRRSRRPRLLRLPLSAAPRIRRTRRNPSDPSSRLYPSIPPGSSSRRRRDRR